MKVVMGVERRWKFLADNLPLRDRKKLEIKVSSRSDIQRMEAVVIEYVRYYPTPSWSQVASALRIMGLYQQANDLTTQYIKGMIKYRLRPRDLRNLEIRGPGTVVSQVQ